MIRRTLSYYATRLPVPLVAVDADGQMALVPALGPMALPPMAHPMIITHVIAAPAPVAMQPAAGSFR